MASGPPPQQPPIAPILPPPGPPPPPSMRRGPPPWPPQQPYRDDSGGGFGSIIVALALFAAAGVAGWLIADDEFRDGLGGGRNDAPPAAAQPEVVTPAPVAAATPAPTIAPVVAPTAPPATATPPPPPTATLVPPTPTTAPPTATPIPTREERLTALRQLALDRINQDRAAHGLAAVTPGFNRAAQLHAEDMLAKDYFGTFWLNGSKPYMVYTQTGGNSYVIENAFTRGFTSIEWSQQGCAGPLVDCAAPSPEEAIAWAHQSFMVGNDNNAQQARENLLAPSHRAVNIGIAWNDRRVVLVQHFEGGELQALSPPVLLDDRFLSLSARKTEPGVDIPDIVVVYYDPPPESLSPAAISALDTYCVGGGATDQCVNPAFSIFAPPEAGYSYPNLKQNQVIALDWQDTESGFAFSADVGLLMQRAGVYTVVVWRGGAGIAPPDKLLELSVFVE